MTLAGTHEMNDCIYRNRAATPVLLDKPTHTIVRSLVAALLLWSLGVLALHAQPRQMLHKLAFNSCVSGWQSRRLVRCKRRPTPSTTLHRFGFAAPC